MVDKYQWTSEDKELAKYIIRNTPPWNEKKLDDAGRGYSMGACDDSWPVVFKFDFENQVYQKGNRDLVTDEFIRRIEDGNLFVSGIRALDDRYEQEYVVHLMLGEGIPDELRSLTLAVLTQ